MNLEIVSENDNPLFNRKEVEGTIDADVAPSREDVRKLISEKFSTNSENIKIRTIKGKFGSKIFIIVANIYKSKEDLDKVELAKKKDIEAQKKVEEPAELSQTDTEKPVEEAPAEQPTEAPKEEVSEKPPQEVEQPAEEPKQEVVAEPAEEETRPSEDKLEGVKEE